jgi:ABC-type amino acid transport substrate-binding protein
MKTPLFCRSGLKNALVLMGLGLLTPILQAAPWVYPSPPDGDTSRYSFEFTLLQAVLDVSGAKGERDTAVWSPHTMSLARAREEVAAGRLPLVHSFATAELDRKLNAVPFAIDKGLNSQRVLLTRRELLPRLAQMRSASDLQGLRFGVVTGWSDKSALEALGLKVEATPSLEGLFSMLAKGRSDVILTGVLHRAQVEPFLRIHPELAWEPTLLIGLPSHQRFYTAASEDGRARAQRLLEGLRQLQANGELERLLQSHFGAPARDLAARRVIKLDQAEAP